MGHSRSHKYATRVTWTGNTGRGTADYRAYSRNHEISGVAKSAVIPGSSDAAFRGDASRYNPEELLVAALSACHMLSYLHLCADTGIVVTHYSDDAEGAMMERPDGSGAFEKATLRPAVVITDEARVDEAVALHHRAHELCFIANSVRFEVKLEPAVTVAAAAA